MNPKELLSFCLASHVLLPHARVSFVSRRAISALSSSSSMDATSDDDRFDDEEVRRVKGARHEHDPSRGSRAIFKPVSFAFYSPMPEPPFALDRMGKVPFGTAVLAIEVLCPVLLCGSKDYKNMTEIWPTRIIT